MRLSPFFEILSPDHGVSVGPQVIVLAPASVVVEHVGDVGSSGEWQRCILLIGDRLIPALHGAQVNLNQGFKGLQICRISLGAYKISGQPLSRA